MSNQTSDATFDQDVLNSDLPVLVDFWAPWCGPCRVLGPMIEQLGEKVKGKAVVYKLNVDENPEMAARYQIRGIPTVIVFKGGKVSRALVGLQNPQEYISALGV